MEKNIKVRAESLEQARQKFEEELPKGSFILKKYEYDTFDTQTHWYMGDSFDDAIEMAKEELPDPYMIKGDVIPELEKNTDLDIPVNIKADAEWSAEGRVKSYIEDRREFYSGGYGEEFYRIRFTLLTKKGFKGVFGIAKTENTYQVNIYIKAKGRIKYSRWAVIEAEITDEINVANERFLKYAKEYDTDYDAIKSLVSQNIDINYCDPAGRNALFYFCYNDEISQYLIDKGIDFKKIDSDFGDNVLSYCLRNDKSVAHQTHQFLIKNGIEADDKLLEEIREEERREEEDSKVWCSKCNKKVNTVEDGSYYDDGWMKDVDINCEICGTTLDHFRGQA